MNSNGDRVFARDRYKEQSKTTWVELRDRYEQQGLKSHSVETLKKVVTTFKAVEEILSLDEAVRGVRVGTTEIYSKTVVVCAGAWASEIKGLVPFPETRPRKGQILALKMPGPLFRHLIRWNHLYFVPRNDCELVVGATNEDSGFDRNLTAAGLGGLLKGAEEISSVVGAFPVVETWTGLRPFIPDGLPAIGPAGIEGLIYALGHYRNGILLTPGTVKLIQGYLNGGEVPGYAESFSPMRFE